MKRVMSIALAAVLLLCLLPTGMFTVSAATTFTEGYYSYYLDNNYRAVIDDCSTFISGDIVIPSNLGGVAVSTIGLCAFRGCTKLTGVIIPEGISVIDAFSFENCTNLKSITLPKSLRYIDYFAFEKCSALETVYYMGSEDDLKNIRIVEPNYYLLDAVWYYNSCYGTEKHVYDYCSDKVCNVCSAIRPTDHIYEWVVDLASNCTTEGVMHEECVFCHIKRSENTMIPTVDIHTFTDEGDTVCDVCEESFYQVSFNTNGGTSVATMTACPGETITLPAETPLRDGYTFTGWSVTKNGDGIYFPSDRYCPNTSVTLYAQWDKNCAVYERIPCTRCDGDGEILKDFNTCWKCNGTGTNSYNNTCGTCSGSGQKVVGQESCSACYGTGDGPSKEICRTCGYKEADWYCAKHAHDVFVETRMCLVCSGDGIKDIYAVCTRCSGSGTVSGKNSCGTCSGKGIIYIYDTCGTCSGFGTVQVTCSQCEGTGTVIRKPVSAPSVPTFESITANAVILQAIENGEYSLDATTWQDSPAFLNLEEGRTYHFYQRYAKTDTTLPSNASAALTITVHNHIYSNGCDAQCNICQYVRPITHTYDGDCDDICNVCSAKRESDVEHTYTDFCDTACDVCGYVRLAPHNYDGDCDARCNDCQFVRRTDSEHTYDNDCDTTCRVCGHIRAVDGHRFENACDAICDNCGHHREVGDHVYDNGCDATCNICGYVRVVGEHIYDNVCDSVCNVCGFARDDAEHVYDHACDATCNLCGFIRAVSEHVYDDEKDHYCNVCNHYALLKYETRYYYGSQTIAIIDLDENYSGALVIPKTINGYPVTEIAFNAFANCSQLTSITIPDSILYVGSAAFEACDSLTEVHISDLSSWCKIVFSDSNSNPLTVAQNLYVNGSLITDLVIPEGVTSIGEYAFFGCSQIETVTIPNSVTAIGRYAFAYCENVKKLTLGNRLSTIGGYAFFGCDLISEVVIPESVTTIESGAFFCQNLKKVEISNIKAFCNIAFYGAAFSQYDLYLQDALVTDLVVPEGVTILHNGALAYCNSLKSVSLPHSLLSIEDDVFLGCLGLTSIVVPENVAAISEKAFKGCPNLISLSVADNNTIYHSQGNCIIETATKTLVIGIKTSVIPLDGSVVVIGDFAFDGCDGLRSVVIPDGVTTIKYYAFGRCKDLVAVEIPNSVTTIENAAFADCVALTAVALPNQLTILNQFVFNDCYSLRCISIPKSLITIMYAALRSCPICNIYYAGSDEDKALMTIDSNNGSMPSALWQYNTCETHVYDHACDTTCNKCSWVRTATGHIYADDSIVCSVCGKERYITVLFRGWGGDVVTSKEVRYGDEITFPAAPVRAPDGIFVYSFIGWNEESVVSDTVTYIAVYSAVKCKEGWNKVDGKWYYCENDTILRSAWRKDSIGWVYLGGDGYMLTNSWCRDSVGWCYVGADGYAVTNCWKKDSVGWCYLNANGSMTKNAWVKDGGKWYFLNASGYMVANQWRKDSKGWVYLGSSGAMLTNSWVRDSVGWCYVGADGYAVTNTWKKDSVGWCYLNANGSMTKNAWVKTSGKWYYCDASGYMLASTSRYIGGKTYHFNASGVCTNP